MDVRALELAKLLIVLSNGLSNRPKQLRESRWMVFRWTCASFQGRGWPRMLGQA